MLSMLNARVYAQCLCSKSSYLYEVFDSANDLDGKM